MPGTCDISSLWTTGVSYQYYIICVLVSYSFASFVFVDRCPVL